MPTPAVENRLRVYNTLTRQEEEFRTVHPGKVGMYVCGPTVYKPSHIGHMVGPVIFDTIKRYLTYLGYEVTFVVNITDVDDKLIVRAREQNTTVKELAERMTADYLDCLKQLNVTGIDIMPKATEHIGDMLAIISQLIDKGFAYPANGDVYFDISKDADYGKLCNRDPEQLEAGSRIEVSERKRNPGDFALWKGAKPGEPQWDSPWGPGRPGWHIECSAMSMKILGTTLDIHGGGLDLQFPHHENELAQSESATGQTFARYWLHNGLMKMGDIKMAGSVGNVINVVDLLKEHRPETVRVLLLGTHYRSPIEYSPKRLEEVRRSLESFHRFFERYHRITGTSFYEIPAPARRTEFRGEGTFLKQIADLRERFLDSMDHDFNTGGAIGVLYELLTALNKFADENGLETPSPREEARGEFEAAVVVLRELSQILGIFHQPEAKSTAGNDELVTGLMRLVIDLRDALRRDAKEADDATKKKLFGLTDVIRSRLGEMKILLEDRNGVTDWRFGEPPQPKAKKTKKN
jgi:cysteinyl-tRNA synthetase